MKKNIFLFCVYHFLMISFLYSDEAPIPKIYSQIKDIYHPTYDDYKLIQNYLASPEREGINRIKDRVYTFRAKTFKIIGDPNGPYEGKPVAGILVVNSDKDKRENCILLYSSYNNPYPKGLQRLVNLINTSDFKGHVLYRLGGWPDEEGGSLVLAHVPYAFKISFFKEAQRLGYKRALWLDTAVVPIVSLNQIFKMIEEKGYFVMGNSHMIGPYMNETVAAAFGLTLQDTFKIPSCSAGLFGVDFTNKKGIQLIDQYLKAAKDRDAFYSARQEQNALSIILYQAGIKDFADISLMPHSKKEIKLNSLFLLDRSFGQNKLLGR
jgi:hypothetical protein